MPSSSVKTMNEIIRDFEDILRVSQKIDDRLSTDRRYLGGIVVTRSLSLLTMIIRYENLLSTFINNLKKDIICDDKDFLLRFITHAKSKLHTSLSFHIQRLIDDAHLWDPRPPHLQDYPYVFSGGFDRYLLDAHTDKMGRLIGKLSVYKAELEHELHTEDIDDVRMDGTAYSY